MVWPERGNKISFKTRSYIDAKNLAQVWIYRGERLFAQLRSAMLTDDQIIQLVADYPFLVTELGDKRGEAAHRRDGVSLALQGDGCSRSEKGRGII